MLPKKITPDSLLETFVEVHYKLSDRSPQHSAQLYRELFAPEFSFVEVPLDKLENVRAADKNSLYYGQGILFRLHPTSISFTCSEGYLGWFRYQELFQLVLTRLYQTGHLHSFTQLGVRYINALPWAPLNQQLLVKLPELPNLTAPEHTMYQASLKTFDGFQVNLTLTDKQQILDRDSPCSLFDVDIVWKPIEPISKLQDLFGRINLAHTREKEVFFGLLSKEFLAELNPQYDDN